jgi:geranylgeranyl pyrophosphate synthase
MELIHAASLLHDDVVDHTGTRRGCPTLHTVWSNKLAVLGGDFILAQALQLLVSTRDFPLLDSVASTVSEMGEGEIMQIFHLFDAGTTEKDYFDRIRKKTAVLMACACEVGARLAGAPPVQIEAARTYGLSVGLAFQVVDDLLDFIGDQARVGKPVMNDLRNGNLTLPVIHALAHPEGAKVRDWVLRRSITQDRLDKVGQLVIKLGSLEYARRAAARIVEDARASLHALPLTPARELLDGLALFTLDRDC